MDYITYLESLEYNAGEPTCIELETTFSLEASDSQPAMGSMIEFESTHNLDIDPLKLEEESDYWFHRGFMVTR